MSQATGSRTIEILVSPAGAATVTTRGFAGPSCRDASRLIERALGERAAETLTAEFHQPQPAAQRAESRA